MSKKIQNEKKFFFGIQYWSKIWPSIWLNFDPLIIRIGPKSSNTQNFTQNYILSKKNPKTQKTPQKPVHTDGAPVFSCRHSMFLCKSCTLCESREPGEEKQPKLWLFFICFIFFWIKQIFFFLNKNQNAEYNKKTPKLQSPKSWGCAESIDTTHVRC